MISIIFSVYAFHFESDLFVKFSSLMSLTTWRQLKSVSCHSIGRLATIIELIFFHFLFHCTPQTFLVVLEPLSGHFGFCRWFGVSNVKQVPPAPLGWYFPLFSILCSSGKLQKKQLPISRCFKRYLTVPQKWSFL